MLIDQATHRVTIYQPTWESDGYGGQEETGRELVCKVWADFMASASSASMSGRKIGSRRETFAEDTLVLVNQMTVFIWPNKKVKRGMVMVEGDDEWEIYDVSNASRGATVLYVRRKEVGN